MTPIRKRRTSRFVTRPPARTTLLLTALLAAGCGGSDTDYSELNLQDISGRVTFDGDPVVGATVIFEAEDKTFSSGVTDESGRYELMFNSERSGVTPGAKIVRIGTMLGAAEVEAAEAGIDGGGDASATEDELPTCYNSESKLRATVSDSATMNFELRSDCTTTGPSG